MRRVTIPLQQMGARVSEPEFDGLPLEIRGGRLRSLRYAMPVSSAQVKSALLLAGYAGKVPVSLREPTGRSRDHTERMFRGLGLSLSEQDGWIEFVPGASIPPFDMQIPGDVSSAAFLVGAAVLAQGGELALPGVGVNPTRTGFLAVLERMGARIEVMDVSEEWGEPVGTLLARPAQLRGVEVGSGEIPGIIDEIPLLAVLATRSQGVTVFREAGELRVKESDRLGLLAANIRAIGGSAEVQGNDLVIEGREAPPLGRVTTANDHRLAMAFAVLGTIPGARLKVDNPGCADVSFPRFHQVLKTLTPGKRRGQ
jgi:3-phosphoshikimate 1-carboxyvinyltransferase